MLGMRSANRRHKTTLAITKASKLAKEQEIVLRKFDAVRRTEKCRQCNLVDYAKIAGLAHQVIEPRQGIKRKIDPVEMILKVEDTREAGPAPQIFVP